MKSHVVRRLLVTITLLSAFLLGACGVPAQTDESYTDTSVSDAVSQSVQETVQSAPQDAPEDIPQDTPESLPEAVPQDTPQQPAAPTDPANGSELCVRFLDVGQADCAVLECDGHYMLIDGGNREDSNLVYSVLKALDISHFDMMVGTHAHEDHIGGIPGAFQYATADRTLSPVTTYTTATFEKFASAAQSRGGGLTVPSVGDTYPLGAAEVTVLGLNSGKETNDTSIVLKVQLGQVSFLFTGDAERAAEEVILDSGADVSATVLKVGHHGSSSSTSYPFLRQVLPLYAVISVGRDNDYGHPEREVLDRLEAAEADVLRTDELGDIVFTTDGRTVKYYTGHRAATTGAEKQGASGQFEAPDRQEEPTAPVRPTENKDTQAEQPEPSTSVAPAEQQTEMVWIPTSGKKYHRTADCSNMENPSHVTLNQAENLGFTPCKRCY